MRTWRALPTDLEATGVASIPGVMNGRGDNILSIMPGDLSVDLAFNKRDVFQLLAKFDLWAGHLADVFASYPNVHPARDADRESSRGALRKRVTASQIEVLKAAGRLPTANEIGKRLGLSSRRSVHKKPRISVEI
jgi:hypothetical protein